MITIHRSDTHLTFILCVVKPRNGSTIRAVAISSNSQSSTAVRPCEGLEFCASFLHSRVRKLRISLIGPLRKVGLKRTGSLRISLPPVRTGCLLSFVRRVMVLGEWGEFRNRMRINRTGSGLIHLAEVDFGS